MSFFGSPDDGFVQGSSGPRVGFFEGLTTGYNQQYIVDSELALEEEIYQRWQETVQRYQLETGESLPKVSPDELVSFRREQLGETVTTREDFRSTGLLGGFFFGASPEAVRSRRNLEEIRKQSETLQASGFKGFDEIFAEVQELQRKTEAATSSASERGGFGAAVGQVLGGIGGTFTARDPTTIITAPLGGAGKSVVTRLLSEAVVVGAAEAYIQYGSVAENRRLAGLPEGNPLQNVLLAAGGAAALRGIFFELPGAAVRRFEREAEPQVSLDFEDAQLRQMLGQMLDTPRTRAALDLLNEDAVARQMSPYGTGYAGLRRFTEETAEAELALLGRSDTAVGRALPPDAAPLPIREREADFEIVREQSPEVAARYDAAEQRLAQFETEIEEVQLSIQNVTPIDAVRLVDETAADQLAALAARTDLPEEALALEADLIFTRVGKERILKAVEDAEITPRKRVQRLQKQRKAASKEYRAALRQMEAERTRLNNAADRVKALMSGETKDLLGYAIATRPMQGSNLSRERVAAQRELILKDVDRIIENAPTPAVRETGEIELGDAVIPAGFRMLDDDGNAIEVSALLRDLDEDARLAEAMRVCSV